mgnify:CR=1 FL=1|tara:strand:+ start:82 stop:555 length:474 start_codon:yes stop_codon:yes gene_type:complete
MKKLLIIIAVLVIGCKAKQPLVETEVIKIDSLKIDKKEIIFAPVASSLTIHELCDTITGKARPFKSEVVRGKDTIDLEVKDNSLYLSIDLDSLINSEVSKEKSTWESNNKREVVVEYKTHKLIWYILIGLLLVVIAFVMFPVIPKIINSLVRKVISV